MSHVGDARDPAQERQADAFAAELLIPERLLSADRERFTQEVLTKRYRVSRQALDIRMEALATAC